MANIQTGASTSGLANVDSQYNLMVNTPGYNSGGVAQGGGSLNAGAVAAFSENDPGIITAVRDTLAPESDLDYRLRVAHDNLLDKENFNYTTQNVGKHGFISTTMTAAGSTAGITTNSSSITTTTTGLTFGTYAMYPVGGTDTVACETSASFSAQPNANTVIDFGLFQRASTQPYAPTDGVYFRMSSSGLSGVINSNGVETTSAVFTGALGVGTFTYTNNTVYRFLIQVNNVSTTFWINNIKYAEIPTPVGANFPCKSQALPWSFRHAITGGAAGAVTQFLVADYKVYLRGVMYKDDLGNAASRIYGAYQGLPSTGGGQLIAGTVTSGTLVKPTAAVPLNASLASNLPNSLGGRIYEQLTTGLAVNTDAIFAIYTVPAGTAAVPGRRLKINGIKLSGFVSTVVVGGPTQTEWYIVFGATGDALTSADSGSFTSGISKGPRRVMLPELTTTMTAAQAANTLLVQPAYSVTFTNPIYVNPGERIGLAGNKTGTVATSGVLSFVYQFDYSWE